VTSRQSQTESPATLGNWLQNCCVQPHTGQLVTEASGWRALALFQEEEISRRFQRRAELIISTPPSPCSACACDPETPTPPQKSRGVLTWSCIVLVTIHSVAYEPLLTRERLKVLKECLHTRHIANTAGSLTAARYPHQPVTTAHW
jgi:hypothetical protein